MNIKNNKFDQNFEFSRKNKITIGLSNLNPLIKLWISNSQNKTVPKLNKRHQESSIHELLILENFYGRKNLKAIANKIYETKNLNSNDALLLSGFYFRLNDFQRFNDIIQTKLSNQFDKGFIINNFSFHDNIFYKTPDLHTILASKI